MCIGRGIVTVVGRGRPEKRELNGASGMDMAPDNPRVFWSVAHPGSGRVARRRDGCIGVAVSFKIASAFLKDRLF